MPSKRTYPHVQSIQDTPTRTSIQKNWDETHNQADRISALEAQVATLQSTISSLQASVDRLQARLSQAIVPSGEVT